MRNLIIFISLLTLLFNPVALPGQNEEETQETISELEHYVTSAAFDGMLPVDLTRAVSILEGDSLQLRQTSSLGDTLAWEPGIHSTYYGPGASRPIIRGFEGNRIQVLKGGINTLDVSSASPDHAVGVEPLLMERIEVIRGPATLLYGNSAIGGVVNVIGMDRPSELPEKMISGETLFKYGTAGNERSGAVNASGAAGNIGWKIGGLIRRTDDYEIPGRAGVEETEQHGDEDEMEEEAHADEHEDGEHHEQEITGILDNSFIHTNSGSVGLAWFGDKGSVGASFSLVDSLYGVPGHAHGNGHEEEAHHDEDELHEGEEEGNEEAHHEEEGEEHMEDPEDVVIELRQMRYDFNFEALNPLPALKSMSFRFGYSDYEHFEVADDEVESAFAKEGFELRMEGVHESIGPFEGTGGLQIRRTKFENLGVEAVVPANTLLNWALFFVERTEANWGSWEFGARFENQSIDQPNSGEVFDDSSTSVSLGAILKQSEGLSLAFSSAYVQRLPTDIELFAFGPHAAIRSFQIGDRDLANEESIALDIGLRKTAGFLTGRIGGFYTSFDNYIFPRRLGEDEFHDRFGEDVDSGGFEPFEYIEREAQFHGFEAESRFHFLHTEERHLHLDLMFDYVRATNRTDKSDLPRIPPFRVGVRLEFETPKLLGGLEIRHVAEQDRIAHEETSTDGYYLFNADFRYRFSVRDRSVDFFVRGANLTDQEARVHTSFVKDLAPLPGRDITVGIQTAF